LLFCAGTLDRTEAMTLAAPGGLAAAAAGQTSLVEPAAVVCRYHRRRGRVYRRCYVVHRRHYRPYYYRRYW
jgi:hypothetical protein